MKKMTETNFRAFHEEHKHKIGSEYRLEVLKMSKEDIYDFLDVKHSDNCFGWLKKLTQSDYQVESLTKKVDTLKKELDELKKIDNGLSSDYLKEATLKKNEAIFKLSEAELLIDKLEHFIVKKVPSKFINTNPHKKLIKEYKLKNTKNV